MHGNHYKNHLLGDNPKVRPLEFDRFLQSFYKIGSSFRHTRYINVLVFRIEAVFS